VPFVSKLVFESTYSLLCRCTASRRRSAKQR